MDAPVPVAARLVPFAWDHDAAIGYEVAIEAIGEAVACYTALIARAESAGDRAEAGRLDAGQTRCVEDRRALRSDDHDGVERVLRDYPVLIRRLREQLA